MKFSAKTEENNIAKQNNNKVWQILKTGKLPKKSGGKKYVR
jgi:hypothetical protein